MNISDVEKRTGLPSTAIRYYENCGLVQVQRKANGYRTYDEETVALLRQIRQLRELGISLVDIRLWRDEGYRRTARSREHQCRGLRMESLWRNVYRFLPDITFFLSFDAT